VPVVAHSYENTYMYIFLKDVPLPPSPIPGVAPKKCGPPAPWGLDTPGGPPFWTWILVETKSDLGCGMVKMEV
jgi:hypothetical protein